MISKDQPLTDNERRLLGLIQEIRYGRIEGLVVKGGEPVVTDDTRVVRDVKFGSGALRHNAAIDADYRSRPQVGQMIAAIRKFRDGTIQSLEVHDGLPFRMSVMETIQA